MTPLLRITINIECRCPWVDVTVRMSVTMDVFKSNIVFAINYYKSIHVNHMYIVSTSFKYIHINITTNILYVV